jgi:Zn-dependent peptidase ImmA (M78 family)
VASALGEVRALAPQRALPPWEARILAERQAARLLTVQGVRHLPVPEQMIEYLPRIEVVYRRARSLSGSATWTDGRWVICVNANDTWGRQRFSMAHELKHVIDAPDDQLLYRDRRGLPARVQRERAADCFAASLLMPKMLLKRAVFEDGLRTELSLARHCQVSVAAMRWRLDELGLLTPSQVAA